MHTLRYITGDSIFFPALMQFATNPKYTYHNLVTTDDVEQFFSAVYGKDLKPLFDLYLRTTQKLEILVKQISNNKYNVRIGNLHILLPVQIQTSAGLKTYPINQKGLEIESTAMPVIDPTVFYLKRVIYE